jgi:hypothetical protein
MLEVVRVLKNDLSPSLIQRLGEFARLLPRRAGPSQSFLTAGHWNDMYLPISLGTIVLIIVIIWLVRG